jgi:hypothetical protein
MCFNRKERKYNGAPLATYTKGPNWQYQHHLGISWECIIPGLLSDLLNLSLEFNKIHRQFIDCIYMINWINITGLIEEVIEVKQLELNMHTKNWINITCSLFILHEHTRQQETFPSSFLNSLSIIFFLLVALSFVCAVQKSPWVLLKIHLVRYLFCQTQRL